MYNTIKASTFFLACNAMYCILISWIQTNINFLTPSLCNTSRPVSLMSHCDLVDYGHLSLYYRTAAIVKCQGGAS